MFDPSAVLRAAWSEPPPPRQGLGRARVVEVAVELADADGLAALSMAKVAARLGVTAMALYRHVAGKDELVLLMQDAAVGAPPELDGGGSWREDLERWTWAVLARFRAHPWLVGAIAMTGPPATPHQLAWLERGLRALAGTPLTEPEKLTTILLLDAHVFSDLQFSAIGEPSAPAVPGADYADVILGLLDPEHFPALRRAAEGGAFATGPDPAASRDADFAFALARILDGVERLVDERARGAGPPPTR